MVFGQFLSKTGWKERNAAFFLKDLFLQSKREQLVTGEKKSSNFEEWLFGPDNISGLSRNGPLVNYGTNESSNVSYA